MNTDAITDSRTSAATLHRWPVERTWTVVSDAGRLEQVRTSELSEFRACGILGAAGLGKTYELRGLANLERNNGREVRIERLARLGLTAEGLSSRLRLLSSAASSDMVIYLDALDEVMIPVTTAGLIMEQWIQEELSQRPVLRISCRSAVWPPGVEAALHEI